MGAVQEKLRSIQADALGPGVVHPANFLGELEVGIEPDAHAVRRAARKCAELVEPVPRFNGERRPAPPVCKAVLTGIDVDFPTRAVERHDLPRSDELGGPAQADDRRNAHRSRQDHGVVGRAADVADESADAAPLELRRQRRRQLIGDHDDRRLELMHELHERVPAGPKIPPQPPAHVRDVADPLAQPRVALARTLRAFVRSARHQSR